MSAGTFQEFLDALRAFESGWDRPRYEAGEIQDWQLDQWAGAAVDAFFPAYTSWSELTDDEWNTMSYRSMNTLGFVGYQFGEALLIDLGYYDDDFYYGNGAGSNTWDGSWTGKNGVDSLEAFMTEAAQEVAIREAFGFNLQTIEAWLANAGTSLDAYIGTTRTYVDNGEVVEVTLTLSGILAAAHLRGFDGVANLLLSGTVDADEFGTSILQYVEQFGDYDAPTIEQQIAYFQERLTGDEGLGVFGSNGTADVTADTADVVITWAWGQTAVISDFDPSTDTIFVDWFTSDQIDMSEVDGSVVISVPSNNQSTTLQGVGLSDLSLANFTILDSTSASELLALVGDGGENNGSTGDGGDNDGGTGDGGESETATITWNWGQDAVVPGFDPGTDTIFIDWMSADHLEVSEVNGSAVFAVPSNNQTTTLEGIALAELSPGDFTILDSSARAEVFSLIGDSSDSGGDGTGGGDSVGDGTGGSDNGSDGTGGDNNGGGEPGTGESETVSITWNWGVEEVITDFDPASDILNFGYVPPSQIGITEEGGNLVIEVLGNGGHRYIVENVQAEDLSAGNLEAGPYSDSLSGDGGVYDQLVALGHDDWVL